MSDASRMPKSLQDELRSMPGNDVRSSVHPFCVIAFCLHPSPILESTRTLSLVPMVLSAALRGLWRWRAAVGLRYIWRLHVSRLFWSAQGARRASQLRSERPSKSWRCCGLFWPLFKAVLEAALCVLVPRWTLGSRYRSRS